MLFFPENEKSMLYNNHIMKHLWMTKRKGNHPRFGNTGKCLCEFFYNCVLANIWLMATNWKNEQRVTKTFLENLWQNFFIKKEVTIRETWRTGIKTDWKNYKCVGLIRILVKGQLILSERDLMTKKIEWPILCTQAPLSSDHGIIQWNRKQRWSMQYWRLYINQIAWTESHWRQHDLIYSSLPNLPR